jgi:hypothetical protein
MELYFHFFSLDLSFKIILPQKKQKVCEGNIPKMISSALKSKVCLPFKLLKILKADGHVQASF